MTMRRFPLILLCVLALGLWYFSDDSETIEQEEKVEKQSAERPLSQVVEVSKSEVEKSPKIEEGKSDFRSRVNELMAQNFREQEECKRFYNQNFPPEVFMSEGDETPVFFRNKESILDALEKLGKLDFSSPSRREFFEILLASEIPKSDRNWLAQKLGQIRSCETTPPLNFVGHMVFGDFEHQWSKGERERIVLSLVKMIQSNLTEPLLVVELYLKLGILHNLLDTEFISTELYETALGSIQAGLRDYADRNRPVLMGSFAGESVEEKEMTEDDIKRLKFEFEETRTLREELRGVLDEIQRDFSF